jgi:hypothetical protein
LVVQDRHILTIDVEELRGRLLKITAALANS